MRATGHFEQRRQLRLASRSGVRDEPPRFHWRLAHHGSHQLNETRPLVALRKRSRKSAASSTGTRTEKVTLAS